jgi:hypothetical protein
MEIICFHICRHLQIANRTLNRFRVVLEFGLHRGFFFSNHDSSNNDYLPNCRWIIKFIWQIFASWTYKWSRSEKSGSLPALQFSRPLNPEVVSDAIRKANAVEHLIEAVYSSNSIALTGSVLTPTDRWRDAVLFRCLEGAFITIFSVFQA